MEQKKVTAKERFCHVCGESMGVIESRYYDRDDTCGKIECQRIMNDAREAEREEAHRQVDRDFGYW